MHDRQTQTGHGGAGRDTAATLERLDDALSMLERRMGLGGAERAAPEPGHRDDDISAILRRQKAISRHASHAMQQHHAEAATAPAAGFQAQLQSELARLRDDLNHEMSTSIARQFGGLRKELRSLASHGEKVSPTDLSDGFDRITRELGLVASRVEKGDMGSLRKEVEELKQHVASLAREDTLRDMSERWQVIERELGQLPGTVGTRDDLMAIAERITEINSAIHELPDAVSVGSMEKQVRALSDAVNQLASANASVSPDHLDAIDRRLDEITQAIVAAKPTGPQALDLAPFERIEARITTLARQLEEQAAPQRADAVERKLHELGDRLEAMHQAASHDDGRKDAFETMAGRLDELARRFDRETQAGPTLADEKLDDLTVRLDDLAKRFDRGSQGAPGLSDEKLNDLTARFEDIAGRLETSRSEAQESGQRMFQSIDARMEELARRIEEREQESGAVPGLDHLERRIEEIAQMLSGEGQVAPVPAQQVDTGAIQSLEDQIVALSERLSTVQPVSAPPELADLGPRLAAISEQLATGREDMIAAARQAAEDVVRQLPAGASDTDREAFSHLTADLKALEELSRNADERNNRTFEAIHDTLIKVADRIQGLEASLKAPKAAAAMPAADIPSVFAAPDDDDVDYDFEDVDSDSKYQIEDAPSLDFSTDDADPLPETAEEAPQPRRHDALSPAAAAAMAARSAVADASSAPRADATAGAGDGQAKGLLKGLRNALGRSTTAEPAGEPVAFEVSSDTRAEPDFSDEPIEPGAGTPDLAAIMKRVRAERGGAPAGAGSAVAEDDDAGKSDFIAAARRAARAAAAEASVADAARSERGKKKSKRSGSVIASNRRPLMIGAAAILLALLAMPLVRGYLSGGNTQRADAVQLVQPQANTGSQVADAPAPAPVDTAKVAEQSSDDTGQTGGMQSASSADMPAGPDMASDDSAATAQADVPSNVDTEISTAAMPPFDPATAENEDATAQADTATAADTAKPQADEQSAEAVTMAEIPASIGPTALRDAATQGDPKAYFVIADKLAAGGPGAEGSDMKAAAHWYELGAEAGYAPAQYRIGNFYEKGYGVDRDIQAAMTWYKRAAEQGNASAMHNLAVLYATEIDGQRDMASAVMWFEKAAELGVKDSQVNIGILSARGQGMAPDLVESYKWLSLAAKAGDSDAGKKRDEVAGYMQPGQLEQARGAAKLWKPKPLDPEANTVEVPDSWKIGKETTSSIPKQPAPDMKKAVRNIQAILNKAGFDAGPADGVMGSQTRSAIIAFQQANGMVPNGEIDRALVDKLLEINKQS